MTDLLGINGQRQTGAGVRSENVQAISAIANIVKSSLGPVGLDKMLVDDIGDVTITNDGATILKLLDVEHPAAKVLVELADLQDQEVGDGTTSVVIIASELLKNADELVAQKIHPTTIISGYRIACREAVRYIQDRMTVKVSDLGRDSVVAAANTSMSSKLIGCDSEMFSNMVVDACDAVKFVDKVSGKTKVPIKAINILKAHGQSARESCLVKGYALNCTVAAQQMKKQVKNAKIACLDFSLQKAKMPHGVRVQCTKPDELEKMRQRESDITKERIEKILKTGANAILTTGGIDDLCLKYFTEAGAVAVRRCKKIDLKRIAKATGATLLMNLANLDGEEAFEASCLGSAEELVQERIADDELIFVRGPKVHAAASIILRGPNDFYVDEMHRSIHDALCVVKRVYESNTVVPGGGAVEAALNVFLEQFANTLGSREQLAVGEFAKSLLVIPKYLAVNAAHDATGLISKLCAFHHKAISDPRNAALQRVGLDLDAGDVRDNLKAGVLEPTISKIKSLKFATEAAITILRIDDTIKLNPDPKPQR